VNNSKKRILLINVPSRRVSGNEIPLGLLYAGSIIERCGHIAKIYDPYLTDENLTKLDNGNYTQLDGILEDYRPDIVGFGGIASSFGRTKKISAYINGKHPDILQISGGPLASVYTLLLTRTNVDLVFHGETEHTLPVFMERYCNGLPYADILGISTISSTGEIHRNPLAPQIENLDEIQIPNYNLVDLKAYRSDAMCLITSRGCTNRCSFCYRHMKGHRQHSVPYVINHIKFIIEQFGITQFTFNDELFNANKQWVLDFCDALEREKLMISFGTSCRADIVDEFMLKRMKEVGCTTINYGQESGSDTILKEYRKGVDAKTNTSATLLTRKQGFKCPVQIVIGSPSETPSTIRETTEFLIGLGEGELSINYLIPYPEAPIWEYVEKNQLVADVENYLDEIAYWGGSPILNLTKIPDHIWRTWSFQIKSDVKLAILKKERKMLKFTYQWIATKILLFGYFVVPEKIIRFVRNMKIYG
jgi:anaerobic magnesium-protoporphyrin IX monomethyl ester cyclase